MVEHSLADMQKQGCAQPGWSLAQLALRQNYKNSVSAHPRSVVLSSFLFAGMEMD